MKINEAKKAAEEKIKQMKIDATEKIEKMIEDQQAKDIFNQCIENNISKLNRQLDRWTNHKAKNLEKKNQKIREIKELLRILENQKKHSADSWEN